MGDCIVCLESLESAAPSVSDYATPGDLNSGNTLKESRKTRSKKKSSAPPDLTIICATTCGHIFHRVCLVSRWMEGKRKKTCPVCSKRLAIWDVFRLYMDLKKPVTDDILGRNVDDLQNSLWAKIKENNLLKFQNASLEEECSWLKTKLADAATTKQIGRCTVL